MREKDIIEELEHGIRGLIDAQERAKQGSISTFDELRILESAFSRLFIAVEHICNAIMLFETGNYSKKHFGDMQKLKSFKDKYGADFAEIYQSTYSLRAYADYRKFPQVQEKFNREELSKQIVSVKTAVKTFRGYIGGRINVKELLNKLDLLE